MGLLMMSGKRFELRSYGNDEIWEMKDRQGESLLTWGDIEKKLNQLAEENEQLQNDYRELFSNYVALEEGQQNLMKDKKLESDALDEIATIIKRLGYD